MFIVVQASALIIIQLKSLNNHIKSAMKLIKRLGSIFTWLKTWLDSLREEKGGYTCITFRLPYDGDDRNL